MKLVVPEQKKLIHTMTVPIRWGDMDAMGHVNNTLYFRYMEIARLQWMFEAGVPANPQGEWPVIVNASVVVVGVVVVDFPNQKSAPMPQRLRELIG